jgi:hypothetical protein
MLRARRDCVRCVLDFRQVQREIIGPQRGPLANRRRLSRLQVRVAQAGQVTMLLGEAAKLIDHRGQSAGQKLQPLAHQNQIGVVGDVTACGTEMNNRPSLGADIAIGVHVGHHVVPQLSLVSRRRLEIDVINVGLQLLKLLLADVQAHLLLGLGQYDPQPPPQAKFSLLAEQLGHLGRGVAADERVFVICVRHGELTICNG